MPDHPDNHFPAPMPANKKPSELNKPLLKASLVGLFVFITVISVTTFIAWQEYKAQQNQNRQELLRELNHVKERFLNILYADIAAANAIAVIFKEYGKPNNFERIAAQLMQYHQKVEMINLAVDGVITNAYPYEENKSVIGIDLFANPMLKKETLRAQEKQEIFFAGPRDLMQGGTGILGKVPVIVDGKLKALITVLTKLETIRKALEVDNRFAYQLIKKSPDNDTERYYLTEARPSVESPIVAASIPEGDWELQVSYSSNFAGSEFPYTTAIMGLFIALGAAFTAARTVYQPYTLKKIIKAKTSELAAKEEYYRTLIETSTDAVVLLDANGKVLYTTPSAERISGYSLNELQHLDNARLVHPQQIEMSSGVFQDLLQNPGGKAFVKFRYKHKKGHYIWVEGTYRNLLTEPSVKAIVFNYTDITDRIKAKKKLLVTQKLLKERVKELSTIFKVITILQNENLKLSTAFHQIVEILPQGWQYQEICEAKIEYNGKTYLSKGYTLSPFRQAVTFKLPEGSSGLIEIIYTKTKKPAFEGPFLKEERSLLNTLAEMFQVYLGKKMHQEELSRSEARFRGAFEFSAIGMALTTLDGKFQKVNKAYCELTGYSEAELLRLSFQEITHPEDLESNLALVQGILEGKADYFRKEKRYIHKSGAVVWVNLNVALIRDEKGEPAYFVGQIENITQRKNLETERQKMLSELIVRNQKMEEFAAIVSHNLRAPLSNILGLSGLFKKENNLATEKAIISGIKTSAENLDVVVKELNQLLYFQNHFSEPNSTVDLAALLEEVIRHFQALIDASGAEITSDFSAMPQLVTVRSFIYNIFTSLLSNSLNFRQPNVPPRIKIIAEKAGTNLVIRFQDNGLGIDLEKYGDQIFGLNKRFHSSISGIGLGLFMVKAQLDSLNGSISVESAPNQGTTFTISLPVS